MRYWRFEACNLCLRRSARSQRPSVIAEAMRYEAVQGTTAMEPVDTPNSNFNAPARASVFSAFGIFMFLFALFVTFAFLDSGKIQTDAFEAGRSNGGYPETVLVNDMAKQCSMVYRMSESDVSVHKIDKNLSIV